MGSSCGSGAVDDAESFREEDWDVDSDDVIDMDPWTLLEDGSAATVGGLGLSSLTILHRGEIRPVTTGHESSPD